MLLLKTTEHHIIMTTLWKPSPPLNQLSISQHSTVSINIQYYPQNSNGTLANTTFITVLIFNCSYFGHDCSSCIAATSGTDFPCVWCRGGDPDSGKCVQISECFEMVTVSAEGAHECPNPQIMSVKTLNKATYNSIT